MAESIANHRAKISWPLLGLLLAALLARGGALVALRNNLREDRDAYRQLAVQLVQSGEFARAVGEDETPRPTAYRPPLYPVLLSVCLSPGWPSAARCVAGLHLLLGLLTVYLAWLTARELQAAAAAADEPPPWAHGWQFPTLAGLLVALDPVLVYWSTFVMTETLATCLGGWAFVGLIRLRGERRPRDVALAGFALALAVLCRPTFLPWLGLCGLTLLLPTSYLAPPIAKSTPLAQRALALSIFFLAAGLTLLPWGWRNYHVFGKPIVTTTHGGYTLYLANNADFFDHLRTDRTGLPWDSVQFDQEWTFERPADELAADAAAYKKAQSVIFAQPGEFLHACCYRLAQLWNPLPHPLSAHPRRLLQLARYLIAVWYVAVYVLTAVGIWRLGPRLLQTPWLWGILLVVVFSAVHTVYWSNLRMRAPLTPVIALIAAVGATAQISNRKR